MRVRAVLLVLVPALFSCTTHAVVHTTMSDSALRAQMFEATAREFDDHPEYVDEMYGVQREHRRMRNRFLADSARDLRDPELATTMADLLVEHPESLKRILEQTAIAARRREASRAAFDVALVEQHAAIADILTDSPATVRVMMEAAIDEASRKPAARKAVLDAMRERGAEIADILAQDPATLRVILLALADRARNDPEALKRLLQLLQLH